MKEPSLRWKKRIKKGLPKKEAVLLEAIGIIDDNISIAKAQFERMTITDALAK
jgi:hypothetical protein